MLRSALDRMKVEGTSLRQIGKILGYKQATVISHMANGRVAIPMRKASEIAEAVGLDPARFIISVAAQRQPAEYRLALATGGETIGAERQGLAAELELIAGQPLDCLPASHKRILREVVAEANPGRRWLELAELSAAEAIRAWRPNLAKEGLSPSDDKRLRDLLARL